MAYRRYNWFFEFQPQKTIDEELPQCPFCGESPNWLLDVKKGANCNFTCMCEKCQGKLYTEVFGMSMDKNMRIVDVGSKNINNLTLNAVYHIKSLNTIAQSASFNASQQSNSSTSGFETTHHTTYTPINIEKQKKNTQSLSAVISITAIILFFCVLIWVLLPNGGSSKVHVVVNASSMQVEDLYGTYTAKVTGQITNTSSSTLDYVQITISLYDSAGNVVGTAIANHLNLGKGETWNFSAIGISSTTKPTSCKVTDITYY